MTDLLDLPPPKRHPSRAEGNAYYPLSPHHADMSPEEQRIDRLNALRLQETPEDLVWGWWFFRWWYLLQSGMFFKRFCPSPAWHYQIVRDIGEYPLNAIAAPRGTSKSTILAVEVPLYLLLTRTNFNILLILSTDDMVTKRVKTQFLYQLKRNPLIRADFGEVLPPRGQGAQAVHMVQLVNGNILESRSVRGAMLGLRPDLILIDDAEIDPVLNQISAELVANFDVFLRNHLLPMLDEGESSLYWIGTLLSMRCFLWEIVMSSLHSERWKAWNRRCLDIEDDGAGRLLWPEKFPRERLEREKREWGLPAYNAQRRNRPGMAESTTFAIHPQLTCYDVSNIDEAYTRHPLSSKATLHTWYGNADHPTEVKYPFGEFVSKMIRVVTFDWAKCLSPTSDYCAIHVVGISRVPPFVDTWWSLDLQIERLPRTLWLAPLLQMALKWGCRYIGIEAVGAQATLSESLQTYIDHFGPSSSWVPRPVPITYPSQNIVSKEDRIAGALGWRFIHNRIKLPFPFRLQEPSFSMLKRQIEGFTGLPGATRYDDGIDSLAMAKFIIPRASRISETPKQDPARTLDIHECVKAGITETKEGVQVGMAMDPQNAPQDVITAMLDQHYKEIHRRASKSKHRRPVDRPYIGC